MKQVIQNFKTGELYVDEVPLPSLNSGMILVENKFSLVSAGTERGTVKVAQASLLGKAKQRPDLVKQVLQNIKKEGLMATFNKVKTKLDSLKALGYSTSGVVMASMDKKGTIQTGDRVACAGSNYASHAEVVSVPQNLVAKIPDNVSFEEASFTTLGAIALQGVRQAEPRIGDNVCVIGLGLLGQLTCQILKANGCNVFGIDISPASVEMAIKLSADTAMCRDNDNIVSAINTFTNGYGFDSVIITAAAPSNDPVEFSSEILRKKGKLIVVGAVKMDIPREPNFYQKELELRISCSYGPGRYDTEYEENGVDYPYGYVRWTEQRNMEAFLKLLSKGVVDVKPLITHIFDIDDAEKSYDLILGKTKEKYLGILLRYPENDKKKLSIFSTNSNPTKDVNIGFIGAGSFAQGYLIPNLKDLNVLLDTVVTNNGITSKNVATKFSFNNSSTSAGDIISKDSINTVFIATRHDSHGKYVLEALKAGKNVFVEKPLALNEEELNEIIIAHNKLEAESKKVSLLVGFNRRFSPLVVKAKEEMQGLEEPLVINYRINAGFIAKDHWIQDEVLGGGRIIGEVCHFIDLMQYLTDSLPISVYADSINTTSSKIKSDDNISINIRFKDGSLGNIMYLANGDPSMPKEKIEIFGGGKIFVVNDFQSGEVFKGNKSKTVEASGKGHSQEVKEFIKSIREGSPSPISFESICYTTLATFKINDSLKTGLPQKIAFEE